MSPRRLRHRPQQQQQQPTYIEESSFIDQQQQQQASESKCPFEREPVGLYAAVRLENLTKVN